MFQNEMPYDPLNQVAWMHNGVMGYAVCKVAGSITPHAGCGLGRYRFFNNVHNADAHAT